MDGFTTRMTTPDLLALRIRQLQKRPEDMEKAAETLRKHRFKSKEQFEQRFRQRIMRNSYEPGTLVLIRNTPIEKSMDRKHKPRYGGPYEVVRQTKGGSYVLRELDGALCRQAYAAFRIIPYISRGDPRLIEVTRGDSDDEANPISHANNSENEDTSLPDDSDSDT